MALAANLFMIETLATVDILFDGFLLVRGAVAGHIPVKGCHIRVDGRPAGPAAQVFSLQPAGRDRTEFFATLPLAALGDLTAAVSITLDTKAGATLLRTVVTSASALKTIGAAGLIASLSVRKRGPLVRWLFERMAPLAGLAADPRFARFAYDVLQGLQSRPHQPLRAIALPGGLTYLRSAVRALTGPVEAVFLVSPTRVKRNPFCPHALPAADGGRALTIELVTEGLATDAGTTLIALFTPSGGCVVQVRDSQIAGAGTMLPYLQSLHGTAASRSVEYLFTCAKPFLRQSTALRDLVMEAQAVLRLPALRVTPGGKPIGIEIERAVPTPDGGLFIKGWDFDPVGMIARIDAISPFGGERPLDRRIFRQARPEIDQRYAKNAFFEPGRKHGFVAYVDGFHDPLANAQYRFQVLLKSGATLDLQAPPPPPCPMRGRDQVLGSLSPYELTDACLAEIVAPAAASLHSAHLARPRVARTLELGDLPADPAVSIVIPIYRNIDFLRVQMAAFATDPACAGVELVYVLDSPEQDAVIEQHLRTLHFLYGIPLRLVVHTRNFGYAAAVNAGAAAARGRHLVLCNSDVVPAGPGWLTELLACQRDVAGAGLIGAKLLFDDGSLQHPGLYFGRDPKGRWINRHFHKGYPGDYPAARRTREVPAVTGACVLVRRSVFEQVGGLTEDYVIGDYEDSDLCLKVRAAGLSCWYAADAELYHFERQSINRHDGYSQTAACEYNRWLHVSRWDQVMAAVMGEPDRAVAANRRSP
jgi:O-antigen biosynthesis protein